MKEIPIIYQTEMVRATLAGRKTNTRRLKGLQKINENPDDWVYIGCAVINNQVEFYAFDNKKTGEVTRIKPQFGQKGDLLYVREAHSWIEDASYDDYASLGGWAYKADWKSDDEQKWKPSIHMPKKAARIWIRNTADPIPQRLQDISEADAIAEGIEVVWTSNTGRKYYKDYFFEAKENSFPCPRHSFESLIRSIHGPEIWEKNPFCWKIQFEVLSTTGKAFNK